MNSLSTSTLPQRVSLPPQVPGSECWADVERRLETHTSWVLLTRAHAIKIRKPVDLVFLDYSSVSKRWRWSRREFELGSAFSPTVYVGVLALDPASGTIVAREDESLEPIVVMRRLADADCLSNRVAAGVADASAMERCASEIAALHASVGSLDFDSGCDPLAQLKAAWDVNFTLLDERARDLPLSARERSDLIDETDRWWADHEDMLRRRVLAGRVRSGHGDLRAEHVYMTEPVSLIDPLEFCDALRVCDVGAEVGFLSMEIDALRRPDLARQLEVRYGAATADDSLGTVLPFFKRYRAVVRAKVEWIRALQQEGSEKANHLKRSRCYFELSLRYQMR